MTPSALLRLAHAFQVKAQDFGDFEPYEREDDPDIQYFEDALDNFKDEVEYLDPEEQRNEYKRLKEQEQMFLEMEQSVPYVLKQKMHFMENLLRSFR